MATLHVLEKYEAPRFFVVWENLKKNNPPKQNKLLTSGFC